MLTTLEDRITGCTLGGAIGDALGGPYEGHPGCGTDCTGSKGVIMAKKKIPPRVHTLVICDYVEWSSEEEDVYHLFGVRTRLEADSFPFFQPHLSVFLQVSGYPGQASGR